MTVREDVQQPLEEILYRRNHFALSGPAEELEQAQAIIERNLQRLPIEGFRQVPKAPPTIYVRRRDDNYWNRTEVGKETGRRPQRLRGDGYDDQPPGETRLYAYEPSDDEVEAPAVVIELKRLLRDPEYAQQVPNTDACTDAAMANPYEGDPSPYEGDPSPYEGDPSPDPDAADVCLPSPAGLPATPLAQQDVCKRNGLRATRAANAAETGTNVTVVVLDCFPVFGNDIDIAGNYLDYLVVFDLEEEHASGRPRESELECRFTERPAPPDPPDDYDGPDLDYADLLPYHGPLVASMIRTIARDAHIVGVRVINNNGLTYSTDLIAAIEWIMQNPVVNGQPLLPDPERVVFNLSLGLRRTQPEAVESCCTFHAVNEAALNQAWFVCAAGNDSYMRHENPVEPAAYGHYWHARATDERVISVAGASRRTKYAGYSNESFFAAPSNCVLMDPDPDPALGRLSATLGRTPLVRWHGTSFATPQVAGLLALLLSSKQRKIVERTPEKLKQYIWETAHLPDRWNGVREICISETLLGISCDAEPAEQRGGCLRALGALLGVILGRGRR